MSSKLEMNAKRIIKSARFRILEVGIFVIITLNAARAASPIQSQLPKGFAYLHNVDSSILQDIRYAFDHNFVGRPIEGYKSRECILTDKAAQALSNAQKRLRSQGLSLIVWDCYRPVRAVNDFLRWSKDGDDARMKEEFYPNTDKRRLFALGYLATRSAHSRGSAVDVGIVPAPLASIPSHTPGSPLTPCTAPNGLRFNDGTIDLGTGYDCLDPLASTTHPDVNREARDNRIMLRDVMVQAGFKPYSREWWHFELVNEPFPKQYFDFLVVHRGVSQVKKP